ncbi:MAG: hypothetical protein WDO71_23780 [Bacteroidota bacterium]
MDITWKLLAIHCQFDPSEIQMSEEDKRKAEFTRRLILDNLDVTY